MCELADVLKQAPHASMRFKRGELICSEGQAGTGLYIVANGCVRLQIHGVQGHRQVVAFKLPGDIFGSCAAPNDMAAKACSETVLVHYSRATVTEPLAREPAVALLLIERAGENYASLAGHLARISRLPAIERVQWFFRWLSKRSGVPGGIPFSLPMSQRDIGDYLNVAPETLSRAMQRLHQEGELARLGRKRFVRQPQGERSALA